MDFFDQSSIAEIPSENVDQVFLFNYLFVKL